MGLTGSIDFLNVHRPGLLAGSYSIKARLEMLGPNHPGLMADFQVGGPRFELDPKEVHSMFPPPGSLGDHSNAMPHIIFSRSTLPWERSASARNGQSWLVLLLFDEADAIDLKNDTLASMGFTDDDCEPGQKTTDRVSILEVDVETLKRAMPTKSESDLLTHVRHLVQEDLEVGVVVGCRLPSEKRSSIVHLVSVEDRFTGGDFEYPASGKVKLISLANWRFTCTSHEHSFKGQLNGLNRAMGSSLNELRIHTPEPVSALVEKFYNSGYAPLKHRTRNGQKAVSWYHSPLGGGPQDLAAPEMAQHADQALVFDAESGMFDTSYAAAWELGRMLMISSKHMSTQLYLWKREHAHELHQMEVALLGQDVGGGGEGPTAGLPTEVAAWFSGLHHLEHVPFHYLVPDDRMLPPESMRFFRVDPIWIDRVVDGAFSIGHVTDAKHGETGKGKLTDKPDLSGFIMRSAFVTDWPHVLVDGFSGPGKDQPMPLVRSQVIAPGIWLCLFQGADLSRVDIHQKPEALHYGFESGENSEDLTKKPRTPHVGLFDVVWKEGLSEFRRLDVLDVAKRCSGVDPLPTDYSSADFGFDMMEGVARVRFDRGN